MRSVDISILFISIGRHILIDICQFHNALREKKILLSSRMASNFSIESKRLDGSNRTVLFQGTGDFYGLAYDWIGKNIFWASSSKLHVFNTDNATLEKTLIQVYYPEYIHYTFFRFRLLT